MDNFSAQVNTSSTVLSFKPGHGGACVGESVRLHGHAVLCGEAHRCRQQFREQRGQRDRGKRAGVEIKCVLWAMTRVASLPFLDGLLDISRVRSFPIRLCSRSWLVRSPDLDP